MRFSGEQIANWLRAMLVLILLLSGLQAVPARAGLGIDFRSPVGATISGIAAPAPQAVPPAQGAKASNPDRQVIVQGSGPSYDIPLQTFLPDNGVFLRNLRLQLPVSRIVTKAVQTGHSPRAPPNK